MIGTLMFDVIFGFVLFLGFASAALWIGGALVLGSLFRPLNFVNRANRLNTLDKHTHYRYPPH
jgi:hypothetical protein